jgi:hypothetical protein
VLYLVLISVGVAVAVTLLALAFGTVGWALRRHLAELPGGTPIAAYDLVTGWRRADAQAMALHALERHFDVQDQLAAQSHYRNVTAYSPSISYSYQVKPDGHSTLDAGGTRRPCCHLRPFPRSLTCSRAVWSDAVRRSCLAWMPPQVPNCAARGWTYTRPPLRDSRAEAKPPPSAFLRRRPRCTARSSWSATRTMARRTTAWGPRWRRSTQHSCGRGRHGAEHP